jgi:hypothetical protein
MVPVRLRPIILKPMRAVERVEASLSTKKEFEIHKKEVEKKKEFRELRKAMRAVGWVEASVL